MLQQGQFIIKQNNLIAKDVYIMRLSGAHAVTAPGQFVQISLDSAGFYLRRPFSVCDYESGGFTVIYKVVGLGTKTMSALPPGAELDILTGLGNGYDLSAANRPLLIGGGAGVPPLYALAKQLCGQNKPVTAILGFNEDSDVFFEKEFRELGCDVHIATVAPGRYNRGFVTSLLARAAGYDHYYACGPEPMLKAVYDACPTSGQLSFESRMACGFGACMGCSCKTKYGAKRICKDGPVLRKEEVIW